MSFICLPMEGSVIDKDFKENSIMIIRGSFEEKKKKLANILNCIEDEVEDRMRHLENTTNKDFFKSPLIMYDDNEEFDAGKYWAYMHKVKYLNNIIDVIYWANIYPKSKIDITDIIKYRLSKDNKFKEYKSNSEEKNKFFFVIDKKNYKRFPLQFKYFFDYELDWIQNDKEALQKFLTVFNKNDKLVIRLSNAIEFFYKAILMDEEYKQNQFNVTLKSDVILFLHTSLECLILKNSDEDNKSLRIRKCVEKNIKNYNLNKNYKDMFDFIKYITNTRGKYVHSGARYKEKNKKDVFSDNNNKLTDFEHLKIITAKMIIKCMEIIYTIQINNISENNYEEEYFKRLRHNKI